MKRIEKVTQYAQEKILTALNPEPELHLYSGQKYRWEHTLRVTQYGKQIAEAEGANVEVCIAACLLHDVEKFNDGNDRSHGRNAARTIRPFLEQTGYSPEDVDNICYSVAVHVDGQAGYEHEHTLEAKVVSDADNVDRFGAYRILLWCVDDMGDYDLLAEKLKQRIVRLEDYLNRDVLETPTGNRLFHEQVRLQLDFFRKFVQEHEMTHPPNAT